ncbi:MAG TPA: hypothetical protein PK583_00495 [Gammaproteobacteria bacterium]|nr:hypothetical protein [Gammaproteobacteria bacterium]
MHNGQKNKDNAEQKNDQPQVNALVTTTAATTSTCLTRSARHSISPRALTAEITTCTQATAELIALSQDLYSLLATEGPNIARIPEILTRRLSTLFPFAAGTDMLSKIQSATTQLMTFGVNPALALHGVKKAMGAGVGKIDQGKHVLASAIHSAGGPASDALDLYHTCAGLYSFYNTYTELNRLYASILFCSQRVYTSAQELAELTGTNEQWGMINEVFLEYWDQPGFDFNAFINQTAEQFKIMLDPLKGLIVLYETMEPVRMATYLAITMRAEPNAESQLDQVTYLLTNACYNTALDNLSVVSKGAGDLLGRELLGIAVNAGTTAALTTCAITVTGMNFPITIAILATCITNPSKRDALITYAKSLIMNPQVGETKSDTGVRATVLKQLEALKNRGNASLSPLAENISPKINQLMKKCLDASGAVVGNITENAIRTLMRDSSLTPFLKEQMNSVIYQMLDSTLRQTLQIPEEKVFLENIQDMSDAEAAVYQACGALIPDIANLLALPTLVKTQLQATTGNLHVCSDTGKPLNLKEKTIQAVMRKVRPVANTNVIATLRMIQAGRALRTAVQGSEVPPASPSPTVLETVLGYANNAAELPLSALGSAANRELTKGLRIYLVEESVPEKSIPTPAIIFSRKITPRLGGLITSELIEIKSFKIFKKIRGLATALTSLVTNRARTIPMETLENAELKNQSETIVKQNASKTNKISSVLLPLDHPLARLITEQLKHAPEIFDYTKQHKMQQNTLDVQRKRAIDNEALRQQAIELAKIKETAIKCGFGEAFFADFETTPVIQERYTRLLKAINDVDTLPLPIDLLPDEAIKVRQYIKTRLINESEILLSHIDAATERFNALLLNDYSIKEKLAKTENAISTVDNIGWFGTTWLVFTTVAPEAKTHYLALLELQRSEAKATIAALSKPLEDLKEGQYHLVIDYLKENSENAALLSTEVSHYKKTFWLWQSWPEGLIKLDKYLSESVPNVRIHLPQEETVTPALLFAAAQKPNEPNEPKEMYDYKVEAELQLANALKLSEAEAIAASQSKIGPKTIAGWELTDVPEIGNCFYEAVALQLQKNNFPIAKTFPGTRPEDGGTALVNILRRRSTLEFRDRDWAGEEEILALAKELKIVIAIVDTRSENPEFQYYFANWNGTMGTTRNKTEIPQGQMVAELAYTGNHYLSVRSKPSSPTSPRQ